MDKISSSVRKPAVRVNSRGNYLSSDVTVPNMGACYPGNDALLLASNRSINDVIFPGSLPYSEIRIKPEDAACKI